MRLWLAGVSLVLMGCGPKKSEANAPTTGTKSPSRYSDLAPLINSYYKESLRVPDFDFAPYLSTAVTCIDTRKEAVELAPLFDDTIGGLQRQLTFELEQTRKTLKSRLFVTPVHFVAVCRLLALAMQSDNSRVTDSFISRASRLLRTDPMGRFPRGFSVLEDLVTNLGICKQFLKMHPTCFSEALHVAEAQYLVISLSNPKFESDFHSLVRTLEQTYVPGIDFQGEIAVKEDSGKYFHTVAQIAQSVLAGASLSETEKALDKALPKFDNHNDD